MARDNSQSAADVAVYAKNLCKNYGKHHVLHNFCMSVKKGSIYGLLGASGSGKTTLISCIVGLSKWKCGDLLVFGEKPQSTSDFGDRKISNLGYMPQDISLYGMLSFSEVVQFYGRLYSLSSTEINERRIFLTKLLNLPEKFQRISDLSGGQKRRASLALAMVHSPDLLVLDEPTVGLDPLLRIRIWEHLKEIVATMGTTVLITTHYIEEARNSATVGVMTDGRLVAEDNPSKLLETYNCDLLEHAVLQICKQRANKSSAIQETTLHHANNDGIVAQPTRWNEGDEESVKSVNGTFRKVHEFDSEVDLSANGDRVQIVKKGESGIKSKFRGNMLYNSARRIYGYTVVLLLSYLRFPPFLLLVLLLPTFHGGIVFLTFSSKLGSINFGVVNHDLVNWKNECHQSNRSFNSCDLSEGLSCNFLNLLTRNNSMILNQYSTEQNALDGVYFQGASGYLVFPANFSQNSLELLTTNLFASNESIQGSRIHFRVDNTEYLAALLIKKFLYAAYLEFVQSTFASCGIAGSESVLPLKFRAPLYGSIDDDYSSFVMPGFILCLIFGLVSALTGVIIISDKREGTLMRARVAGLAATDVLIGHLITQTILYVIVIIIFGSALLLGTNFAIKGSLWICFALCIVTVLYSAALGVLLGIIFEREAYCLVAAVFLLNNFILYSAAFYPKEKMVKFGRVISQILPTSIPIEAMRSVTVRGQGLMESRVWMGFAVIVPWMLAICICCGFACRRYL